MQAVRKNIPVCTQRAIISFLVSNIVAPNEFILMYPKIAFEEGKISRTSSHIVLKFDNGHIIPDKNNNGIEVKRYNIMALSLFLKITERVSPKKMLESINGVIRAISSRKPADCP